jgi:hypothetical protein
MLTLVVCRAERETVILMIIRKVIGVTWLCVTFTVCCATAGAQSSILQQWSTDGLGLATDTKTVLRPPLLAGASEKNTNQHGSESQDKIEKLAEKYGMDRFTKNSPTAPVHIELNYVLSPAGIRAGHNIYSAFIAYVPLTTLRDQQLITALFGSSRDEKEQIGFDSQEVPTAILQSVGIETVDADQVRYSTLRIPLMNRVLIEGTARIEKFESDTSITMVWQLDEHFTFPDQNNVSADLAPYANRYQKTERNELGQLIEAKPVSYSGFGGYVSVQATGLADQQVLLESRFAMREPPEWFSGSNFLRSKFPNALQESAQTFRRKLAVKPNQ